MIADLEQAQMSNITLEEFTNLSVQQLQQNLESVMDLKISDTKVGALPAKAISYKATMPQLNKRLRTYQTWFLKNNKAYMLSYNDMVGKSLADFERKKTIAERCFASFKLIPKTTVRPPVTEILMRTHIDVPHAFRCETLLAWKPLANCKPPLVLGLEYNSFMVEPTEKETVSLQQLVSVQKLPENVTPAVYAELVKFQLTKAGVTGEFGKAKLGRKHEAQQVTYREPGSDATTVQTWCIRDGRVYTVTYTYAAVSVDERPRNLLSFFLDSFDFITPNSPGNSVRPSSACARVLMGVQEGSTLCYENLMWRFSFRFSPDEFEPAQAMPGAVITLARKGSNGNVTVTAQRAAKNSNLTLDEQVRGVEKQLSTTVPAFEKESTTDTRFAGLPAKQILYSGSAENMTIRFKQLFFVNHDILYFVCVADTAPTFEQTVRDAQPVLDSFTVK